MSIFKRTTILLAILTPVLLVSQSAPLSAQTNCPADTLETVVEFGGKSGESALDHPTAMCLLPWGNVLISDTYNNRLVEFNERGERLRVVGSIGSGDGEFSRPGGLAIVGDRIVVADGGNRRVCVLSFDYQFVRAIPVDIMVDVVVANPDGTICAFANLDRVDSTLFLHYQLDGKFLGKVGPGWAKADDPWHVRVVMNRLAANWTNDGRLVTCFMSFANCRVSGGIDAVEPMADWIVRCDINQFRQWHFDNNRNIFNNREISEDEPFELEDLVSDALKAAQENGKYTNFVSQVLPYRDHILLVVSSMIHEYDPDGTLIRRVFLKDFINDQAYASCIAIDDRGVLFALDGLHTFNCRTFQYEKVASEFGLEAD